tara:strand:- start:474 stop:698 length:225 start_codon:yes stop_codon:yes gene_type:complete
LTNLEAADNRTKWPSIKHMVENAMKALDYFNQFFTVLTSKVNKNIGSFKKSSEYTKSALKERYIAVLDIFRKHG